MQTDKNDMKVEKKNMHLHASERPCKCQIVTDTRSRNTSHIYIKKINKRTVLYLDL